MADDGKGVAWIQTLGVLGAALITAGFAYWAQRGPQGPSQTESQKPATAGTEVPPPPPGPAVMGQLQVGINLQGMDFDDRGVGAPNEQECAELCRVNERCRSMTFVISRHTCWLKAGVPEPYPPGGADYVSAVKK